MPSTDLHRDPAVVPAVDSTANVVARDVIGNKGDTAQTVVGTTRSLMGYLKGALNQLATLLGFHNVPAADALTNAQMRDVVGNKGDASQTTATATRSLVAYLKGVLTILASQPAGRALPTFFEDWRAGFLNYSKWFGTLSGSASITPAQLGFTGLPAGVQMQTGATINSNCHIASQFPFAIFTRHGQGANTTIIEGGIMEWTMRGDQLITSFHNTFCFWGLANDANSTRATNDIIGFILVGDVLNALSDAGGVETVQALTAPPTLVGQVHTYRIEVDRVNGARFFVDHVLQATILTNISDGFLNMFPVFNLQNDVAANAEIDLGEVRGWEEDTLL